MIVPPMNTKSFYTVYLEKDIGQSLASMLTRAGANIQQVLITSVMMDSDIQAVDELQAGILKLTNETPTLEFNPLYIPKLDTDSIQIEASEEGEITSVAGFANPFVVAELKIAGDDDKSSMEARVYFEKFELPPLLKVFDNDNHQVH